MTDGQFWLALFLSFLVINAVVAFLLGEGRYGLGCLPIPIAACVIVTVYILQYEPDPQAGVFLGMFYAAAGVAGALGAVTGWAVRKRLR